MPAAHNHEIARILAVLLLVVGLSDGAFGANDSGKTKGSSEQTATAGDAAAAPAASPQASQPQVEELQRRLEILAAEVEKLRSGEPQTVELTDRERRGLGVSPSAAATYRRRTEGVSLAGYGEMLLEKFANENEAGVGRGRPRTQLDFLRAVLYAGYRFNDKFLFNSEIEYEHGGEEIGVEFAYLDYMVNKHFTLRGGMLLLPLGLTNEFHEPTVFLGAKRPETERRILPSTWHENGAGVLGNFGMLNFRAYVVNGLKAEGFTSSGIRDGRQGGAEAAAEDVAFAGRVDATPVPGVFAGVGLYRGNSGQGAIESGGASVDAGTTIAEVHGQAQIRGFDVRGMFAQASIDDAGALNLALGRALNQPVGERMRGGYFQIGYNVLSQMPTTLSLMPFVRVERVDTQNRVPVGFTRDPSLDGRFTTFGVELKPIFNVVIKTDYQWVTNVAGTGRNQFNVNLGYAF